MADVLLMLSPGLLLGIAVLATALHVRHVLDRRRLRAWTAVPVDHDTIEILRREDHRSAFYVTTSHGADGDYVIYLDGVCVRHRTSPGETAEEIRGALMDKLKAKGM